ncbi:hypothetical protein SUGI_1058470 [Cryptomeria japonica]|uniref:uncharacterized protein LOC131060733 n=1 Tax=Cryptomeria japonica TaxID=3369 RepID=UPI002414765F|nr:uncharacterized protein LOC131060733 [Cryptomeria japonica]GLJ49825.1 hypothetical protein SUGI_1058470 [Cryptomeria japonica]
MGNSIKCCIACMLPCGALDVVRVLHANGHVEEYSRPVKAGEVMKENPKHVLGLPSYQGVVQKTVVLPPEAELQRGKIYFLIPAYGLQKHRAQKPDSHANKTSKTPSVQKLSARKDSGDKVRRGASSPLANSQNANVNQSEAPKQRALSLKQCETVTQLGISEQHLAAEMCENEVVVEAQLGSRQCYQPRKKPESRRSSGFGVGLWRPALESISEIGFE